MSQYNVPERRAPSRAPAAIGLIIVLVLIAVGVYTFRRNRPEPAVVSRRDIVGFVQTQGTVVAPPYAYGEVRAPYSANVEGVLVTIGAPVRRGQVLVKLAPPANGEGYALARSNERQAEVAYEDARRQYNSSVREIEQNLARARAALKTNANNGNSNANTNAVGDQGSTAALNNDDNGNAIEPSQVTPDDVTTLQQSLEEAKTNRDQGLAALQTQLDAARAVYRDARAGHRMSELRAPISGTVIAINAQPGSTVGRGGTPVAIVADLSALRVRAPISEQASAYVKPGRPAQLTFSGIPNQVFDGKVARVTTVANAEPGGGTMTGARYIAVITFKNTKGEVKPNSAVNVAVKAGDAKDAISVPFEAVLVDDSGRPFVRELQNGKWVRAFVIPGITDGKFTQIKTGLKEGETVQIPSGPPPPIPASSRS